MPKSVNRKHVSIKQLFVQVEPVVPLISFDGRAGVVAKLFHNEVQVLQVQVNRQKLSEAKAAAVGYAVFVLPSRSAWPDAECRATSVAIVVRRRTGVSLNNLEATSSTR